MITNQKHSVFFLGKQLLLFYSLTSFVTDCSLRSATTPVATSSSAPRGGPPSPPCLGLRLRCTGSSTSISGVTTKKVGVLGTQVLPFWTSWVYFICRFYPLLSLCWTFVSALKLEYTKSKFKFKYSAQILFSLFSQLIVRSQLSFFFRHALQHLQASPLPSLSPWVSRTMSSPVGSMPRRRCACTSPGSSRRTPPPPTILRSSSRPRSQSPSSLGEKKAAFRANESP